MAFEALRGHIEVMREYGEEIPEPSNLEAVMASPEFSDGVAFLVTVPDPKPKSVRVNIMVPEPELKAIDAAAKARGMSRSSFLVHTAKESIRG